MVTAAWAGCTRATETPTTSTAVMHALRKVPIVRLPRQTLVVGRDKPRLRPDGSAHSSSASFAFVRLMLLLNLHDCPATMVQLPRGSVVARLTCVPQGSPRLHEDPWTAGLNHADHTWDLRRPGPPPKNWLVMRRSHRSRYRSSTDRLTSAADISRSGRRGIERDTMPGAEQRRALAPKSSHGESA